MQNLQKVMRALIARAMFSIHGSITIWCVYSVYQEKSLLLFYIVIVMMVVEAVMNTIHLQGDETRWFCPCIFLYLCSTVPPLWFLELYLSDHSRQEQTLESKGVDKIIYRTAIATQDRLVGGKYDEPLRPRNNLTSSENLEHNLTVGVGSDGSIAFGLAKVVGSIEPEMRAQFLEQTLLVVLILGRWLLPKGELSREQLSQMLLVYLATAADIVELFESFKEPTIRQNRGLNVAILAIWSISLTQYPLVLASAGRRSARPMEQPYTGADVILEEGSVEIIDIRGDGWKLPATKMEKRKRTTFLACRYVLTDLTVWGIVEVSLLQDAPFLAIRLYLILAHKIASYSMIFFTSKNTLVCLLQFYRLIIICNVAAKKAISEEDYAEAAAKKEAKKQSQSNINICKSESLSSKMSLLFLPSAIQNRFRTTMPSVADSNMDIWAMTDDRIQEQLRNGVVDIDGNILEPYAHATDQVQWAQDIVPISVEHLISCVSKRFPLQYNHYIGDIIPFDIGTLTDGSTLTGHADFVSNGIGTWSITSYSGTGIDSVSSYNQPYRTQRGAKIRDKLKQTALKFEVVSTFLGRKTSAKSAMTGFVQRKYANLINESPTVESGLTQFIHKDLVLSDIQSEASDHDTASRETLSEIEIHSEVQMSDYDNVSQSIKSIQVLGQTVSNKATAVNNVNSLKLDSLSQPELTGCKVTNDFVSKENLSRSKSFR